MEKYIENFKEKLIQKKLKENSIKSYISDIMTFANYISLEYQEDLLNVKKTHALTYLVEMQKNKKSSSTIARNISSLKGFYDYLRSERVIEDNPIQNIHSPKHINKIPLYLEQDEITGLMNLPDVKTFRGSRDSAILELLYSSGIKVSELINIMLKDIVVYAKIIHIRGSVDRIVPIGSIALNAINNYLDNFRNTKAKDENEYLFINSSGEQLSRQGVWKILKHYEKLLNSSKELSPQILRNSFAIHMLNNGADIISVQELMGHKNINAMQNYMQATENKSFQTFKNKHPRA